MTQHYQNTALYRNWLSVISFFQQLPELKSSVLQDQLTQAFLEFSTLLATALAHDQKNLTNQELEKSLNYLFKIRHLVYLAREIDLWTEEINEQLLLKIADFQQKTEQFIAHRPNILILSSNQGQGHMSAAKAIKNGIQHLHGLDYNVEIVDFFDQVASFLNRATAKAYESSTKHTPKLWQYFFESTDSKWAVKFINLVNYPLASAKIEKFFESHQPDLVISTYPLWDYLASLVLKKFHHLKFISVVTDSISIHTVWNCAELDYHIVANEETAISLRKIGVKADKIKILGFPVSTQFITPLNRDEFIKTLNLDPQKYTVLFLPTAEKPKVTIKTLELIQKNLPNINIVTICGRNAELYPKLSKHPWPDNFKIISWTNQMPSFIKATDLVITKAGGATVMECVAAKKPMIITQIIPGQEAGNAELVRLHQVGIIQKDFGQDITGCIKHIQQNQEVYTNNFTRISKPDSAVKIAEFIDSLLPNT